ncbi:MAG TPA: helix-turn-helix domain-containing protein [Rhizomicrobium sp.]
MSMSKQEAAGLAATVERHLRDYFAAHERGLPAAGLYDRVLQEIERPLLAITLAECDGNQLRAAELLGLNRNTLRKKIRALGLPAGRKRMSGAA